MACPFSRLPLELVVIILEHAPNLSSIYKFICASASAKAAFETIPAHILDTVIERSIPEFKHLARMVAILGSFSYPTFEKLIAKYKELPNDVLTTAPPSSVFTTGTPGPRYLVLTAYRIETLQHICFVYLLQNIHEAKWPVKPTDIPGSHVHPFKRSMNDVVFQAAAWRSPSWAEKLRITRALWKLVIYWNIREICPNITDADYFTFSQYSEEIRHISPCIGPDLTSYEWVCHEVEEMKCVLAATYEILDCPYDSFTPFTSHKFRMKRWTSSTIFKQTLLWKFEDPKPMEGTFYGQTKDCVDRRNVLSWSPHWQYGFGDWCFRYVHRRDRRASLSSAIPLPQFPDDFGLCIWDFERHLGLGLIYSTNPGNNFFARTHTVCQLDLGMTTR